MPTQHDTRAAKMGYGGPAAAKPRAAAAPIKSLYANPYALALANFYDRREASLRNDPEGLRLAREERIKVETFARDNKISARDLQQALSVVHEYDLHPRSDEAKATLRAKAIEKQRLELGGTEQVKAHTLRVGRVTKALESAVPSLVARVRETGAAVDPRLFDALAPYGEKAG